MPGYWALIIKEKPGMRIDNWMGGRTGRMNWNAGCGIFYNDTAVVWPVIAQENRGVVGALLLGITILSDWIASGDAFAQADDWRENLHEEVDKRARAFLRESGLESGDAFPVGDFCSVWPNIPRQGMRPLQQVHL